MTQQNTTDDAYKFSMRVIQTLATRGEWAAIHFTVDNSTGMNGIGPIGLAADMGVKVDAGNREGAREVAEAIVEGHKMSMESVDGDWYGPDAGDDSDDEYRFSMAVTNELIQRDEIDALQFTAETTNGMGGIGPVEIANQLDVSPDPHDDGAVVAVANSIIYSHNVDCEEAAADRKRADDHRKNDGKWDDDHRIFQEMDRLHEAGADISSWMIAETDVDAHPDYLQIEYHGISADAMEDLRYRHIRHTDYGALASRPLSEIEKRE